MRYVIEWPDQQPPPLELFKQLVSGGATLSPIPLAKNLSLPHTPTLSEKELSLFLDASMAEKTSPAQEVFKRIRTNLNGH